MRDPVLDAAPEEARGDVILMYDELIERLRRCASYDPRFVIQDCEDAADAIEDLITALTASNEVIAKSKPKWIPVTERLPERNYNCLVADDGTIVYGYMNFIGEWMDCLGDKLKYVSHWMPLPEPPECEGE